MRKFILVLLTWMFFVPHAKSQTVEAIHMPDSSFYYRASVDPSVPFNVNGIIVIDYLCTSVPLNGEKSLVASYVNLPAGKYQVLDLRIDNVSDVQGVATGNHLHFSVNNGPQTGQNADPQVLNALSDTIIPCDGRWNQLAITWHSALQGNVSGVYTIAGYIGGVNTPMTVLSWNPVFTGGNINPRQFSTPYRYNNVNNSWTIGARFVGNPTSFWADDLARVYININAVDYLAMQSTRNMSGFGFTHPTLGFRPIRWGINCVGPLRDFPTICMVGGTGPDGFRFNNGSPFVVPQGYLQPTAAQDDIWSGYP
jgi:hypothetical protein